jgi:L-threo-3-deoxy-hexylosonate aldolase
MGEAIHLSHAERVTLIQSARKTLDELDLVHMPVIAGTGAGSTRETLELSKEAAGAGADYVLVIASGYFASALAANREALKSYWTEVAQKSPVPVMIYNCEVVFSSNRTAISSYAIDPGASGGIDLDSDIITDLAKECPNICGVKLTYVPTLCLPLYLNKRPLVVAGMWAN